MIVFRTIDPIIESKKSKNKYYLYDYLIHSICKEGRNSWVNIRILVTLGLLHRVCYQMEVKILYSKALWLMY